MISSPGLAAPRRSTRFRPRLSRPLVALLALCLLVVLAPTVPWRPMPAPSRPFPTAPDPMRPGARWTAPQVLAPVGGRDAATPLSSDRLPAGLYPAVLATLERTAAPAYRLRTLPAAHEQPAGYAAANPAAHLSLRFDAAGLTLRQQGRPGSLPMALAGIGYGDHLAPVAATGPRAHGNEVRYAHPGLVEWYRNGPLGLEQGFTVATPPDSRVSGPLTLRLRLAGELAPRLLGDTLLLGSHGLRYTGLYAADATGRHLSARLALAPERGGWALSVLVDDRGARYPLSIDPTFTLQSTFPDPGTSSGSFGGAVALSRDGLTALVGAPGNVNGGAAFVFSRTSLSVPFPTTPSSSFADPGPGDDGFGIAVALSGDGLTALVGAPVTFKGSAIAGAAYIYSRASASVAFPTSPTTTLADPGSGTDDFGFAVALSGDGLTALIGADSSADDAGVAYIYSRGNPSAAFLLHTVLADPGSGTGFFGDHFGIAVALSGDGLTALVGATGTAVRSNHGAGAAYVYSRPNTSTAFPVVPTSLFDPGPGVNQFGEGDLFGSAVALSGDGLTALIGAPHTTERSTDVAGAAYVYSRPNSSTAFSSPTILADPGSGEDLFGASVALSGDGLTALVGAHGTTKGSNSDAGAAYVYSRATTSAAFPTSPTTALADPGARTDDFGVAVALSGDGLTALVGADEDFNKGFNSGAGVAHVYIRATTSAAFPTSPTTTLPNPHPSPGIDQFGTSVALSSDGLTALIGTPATFGVNASVDGFGGGVAYVFSRSSTGVSFPTTPTTTLADPGFGADGFGFSVAVSADGTTALVGAPNTPKGSTVGAGAAYVYSRSSTGVSFPTTPTATLPDPGSVADNFGHAVALSGDGLTALVGTDNIVTFVDSAYVYSRSSAGAPFPTSPTTILIDPGSFDDFSASLALSADGTTALVGAPTTPKGSTVDAGAAYVYSRSSAGAHFPTTPAATLPDPGSGSFDGFGSAVALSGDALTAVIGAPGTSNGGKSDAGAAYVYSRASASAAFSTSPTTALTDPGTGADLFGSAVALSGDALTALIGAHGTKGSTFNAGAAYVYSRASASVAFSTSPTTPLADPGSGPDNFGSAVALSGDGLTALIGAPGTSEQRIDQTGAVYVYAASQTVLASPTPTGTPTDTPTATGTATSTSTPSATSTATATPTTSGVQRRSIAVQPDWNLISLPLQPTGTLTAADLLGALLQSNHASKLVALYELSGTGWSPFLLELAGHPALGSDFPLAVGAGYLLYSDQKNSYSEQGTVPAGGPTWQLSRGWNLVGLSAGSPPALAAATVLADVLAGGGGGQLAAIYGLSGTGWSPSLLERAGQPPVGTPFTLAAGGQGYLLYTDHAAIISPNASPLAPGPVRRVLPEQPPAAGEPTGGTALPPLPPPPG